MALFLMFSAVSMSFSISSRDRVCGNVQSIFILGTIHTSLGQIGYVCGGAQTIIEALIDVVNNKKDMFCENLQKGIVGV
jgi:hypothetical protein